MRIFPRGSAYTQLTEYSQEDDEEDEGSEVVKLRSLVKRHEKECGNLKNSNADLIKRLSVLDKAEENVESAKSSAEDALEQAQEAVKKRDTARNMGDDPGDVTIGNLSGCRSQQEQDYGNKLERLQQLENERNSAIAEADHARKSLITLQKTVQELEQNIHDEAVSASTKPSYTALSQTGWDFEKHIALMKSNMKKNHDIELDTSLLGKVLVVPDGNNTVYIGCSPGSKKDIKEYYPTMLLFQPRIGGKQLRFYIPSKMHKNVFNKALKSVK